MPLSLKLLLYYGALTLLEGTGMIEMALTEFWFLPVRVRKEVRLYSKVIKRKTFFGLSVGDIFRNSA